MGTLKLDRQPDLLKQYSSVPCNVNDPSERKVLRNSFPERGSKNPFFFRNNPHPSRVRHIKGLLDNPVCSVMDAGYREGVPNLENQLLLGTLRRNGERRKKRETFVPGIGLVSVQPTWVEQLKSLTHKVKRVNENPITGQLEPTQPPSRQGSRNGSRCVEIRQAEEQFVRNSCSREANVKFEEAFSRKTASRGEAKVDNSNNAWSGLIPAGVVLEENEVNVARLLSQILNTDSLDVIKHWLTEAPEKEKEVVLEMLRNVSNTNLEFREVMNKLATNPPETELPEVKDVNISPRNPSPPSNSPRPLSREKENSHLLDVIKENIEADMKMSRASSRESQRIAKDMMILPPISRQDREIEVLRSRLASRSNINVFPTKSSRCSAR